MKASAWIRIACWGFVLLMSTGFLVCRLVGVPFLGLHSDLWGGFSWWEDDKGYSGDGSGSYKIPASGIENIEIDWVAGEVTLSAYDGEEIHFTESSSKKLNEKTTLRYKVSGNTLKIRFRKNGILFGSAPGKDLQVFLPRELAKSLGKVKIDAVSAKIDAKDLQAEQMHYTTTSGPIFLEKVEAERIETDTVSGGLDIENARATEIHASTVSGKTDLEGAFGTIHASGVSGKLTIQSSVCPDSVSASSVSGDVTVVIPENPGFSVSFDRVSGEFDSDFALSLKEGKGSYKDGGAKIAVDTVSGNLSIKKYS